LGILCNVTVVISLHFEEEDLHSFGCAVRNQIVVQQLEDPFADAG